jgi:hypothetical protein
MTGDVGGGVAAPPPTLSTHPLTLLRAGAVVDNLSSAVDKRSIGPQDLILTLSTFQLH